MPARTVVLAGLVLACLQTPAAESQSRRCFVDQFDFVWDVTEVRRDAYVWFAGTVDRDGLDVRVASGVYDSTEGGHWIFQAEAGNLGPGFVYQLSSSADCCESTGAWIDVSLTDAHGPVETKETSCDDLDRRPQADPSALVTSRPGDIHAKPADPSRRTGNFCLVDEYSYLWDLDVIGTDFGKKFFRGVVATGPDLRTAVGIGSEDRARIALATTPGDSVPFAYNIAWDDPIDSGSGSWIHADPQPGAGIVDFLSLTSCNEETSGEASEIKR